jgi:hypothetical protein
MGDFTLETLGVSTLELILIIVISFIASIMHEYMISIKRFHIEDKIEIINNIIMTVLIDTIICIAIDPLVAMVSQRLILIPPLILGLIGPQLLYYFSGISSTAKLIRYILSTLGIKKFDKEVDIDELEHQVEEKKKKEQEEAERLEKERKDQIDSDLLLKRIVKLILAYVNEKIDKSQFVIEYRSIDIATSSFKESVSGEDVPIHTAMKLAEIIRNKEFLDKTFNQIISQTSSPT